MGHDAGFTGVLLHLDQIAFARTGEFFDHGAGIFVIHIDGDFFDRLQTFAILALLEENLRARDRQFKAFAAHVFDKNAHLQFATPRDFEGFAAGGVRDLDGDVGFGLFHQAVADHAGLDLFAIASGKGAVVDPEGHCDGGRVNRLCVKRFVHREGTDRVSDRRLGHAGQADDIACLGFFDVLLAKAAECLNAGYAELFDLLADA